MAGSRDGWHPAEPLRDKNGTPIRLSTKEEIRQNKRDPMERHLTSIAAVDWDDDGDLDLLLGAYGGALHLKRNEGAAGAMRFATSVEPVSAGGKPVVVPGGLTTPKVVDWDGDGCFDLLCGGMHGAVYLYRNVGAKGRPDLAAPRALIERRPSNEQATWPANRFVRAKDGLPSEPGDHFYFDAADYDGDGDLDLVVGALSYLERRVPRTESEKEALASVLQRMTALRDRMKALRGDAKDRALRSIVASPDYRRHQIDLHRLKLERNALSPPGSPANLIWLFRNTARSHRGATKKPSTER